MSTVQTTNIKHAASASNNITLDASGNIGMGVAAPTQKLELGATTACRMMVSETGSTVQAQVASNTTETIFGAFSNHPVAFRTNNSERMRIDTSGNVGIGNSSPSTRLDVTGIATIRNNSAAWNTTPNTNYGLNFQAASTGVCHITSYSSGGNTSLAFATNSGGAAAVESMRIDPSGNVGIGTSSPTSKLHVAGGSGSTIRNTASSGSSWFVGSNVDSYILHNESNTPMLFTTNGTERARITSGGNFLVGTSSTFDVTSGATTQLSGQCAVFAAGSPNTIMSFYNSTQSARVGFIGSNGNSTSYNSGSDYRLKENVTSISGAAAAVQSLRPVTFTWKFSPDSGTFSGFIAHELQEVWSEAVSGEKDGVCKDGSTPNYQMVDQSKLVPLLTAALQEALTEIAALKARVAALETK